MGNPIPPTWPILIPGKWYCIKTRVYFDVTPKTGCNQEFVQPASCCIIGAVLQAMIDDDAECTDGKGFCIGGPGVAERLMAINGPFDTEQLCTAWCVL